MPGVFVRDTQPYEVRNGSSHAAALQLRPAAATTQAAREEGRLDKPHPSKACHAIPVIQASTSVALQVLSVGVTAGDQGALLGGK
jgi:hypothetical protein